MSAIIPIRLSQLTAQIQQAVQNVFVDHSYWIIADVTNYSFYSQKNYHYFDLVEKADSSNDIQAKVCAVAWGTGNQKIRDFEKITGQKFKNDINVLVKVTVEYHPVHGLKLTLLDVDVNFTIGILEQQRQLTLKRLLSECSTFISKVGETYVTNNKQLNHRAAIKHIAVVSSKSSAGLQDFLHTIDNNTFDYKFQIDPFYTTVQGETSVTDVYNTLLHIYNTGSPYDTVVIIRGGGAQTDFLIFDQFPVAKIVAKYPIPIITGIGHQKNETIVDLLAHTSTKTPTKAAEFIIAHNKKFEDDILLYQKTILIKTQQIFSLKSQSLSSLNTSIVNNSRRHVSSRKDELVRVNQVTINHTKTILLERHREIVNLTGAILSKPKILVSNELNNLNNLFNNIRSYSRIYFMNQTGHLEHYIILFKFMSPANILKKGFAIIRHKGIITSAADRITKGDEVSIILSGKEIQATVQSKSNYDGDEFNI